MTKRQYQEAQRAAPLGEEGLAQARAIVADKRLNKVREQTLDLFSASAIVAVADALNPENRAKFLGLPVLRCVKLAFQLLNGKG